MLMSKSKYANCLVNAEQLNDYPILDTEGNVIAVGKPLTVRDKLFFASCNDDEKIYETLKRGLRSWEVSEVVDEESIDKFSIVSTSELLNIVKQVVEHNMMTAEIVEFEEKN